MAIRCARMFTGEQFSDGPATVLLDREKIIGVETGHIELDKSWQIVEFANSTVLPGLIDTHVHLVADSKFGALDRVPGLADEELDTVITEGLRAQLAAGVTTVRDLGDRRYAVVNRRDQQRARTTREPEATIVASGPPLTSVGGHCYFLGGEVATTAQISAAIRERVERGVDVVKVMASGGFTTIGTDVMRPQFSADEMRSIVEETHDAGLPVTAHAHALPAVEQAIEAGVDCLEHCSCLTVKGSAMSDELVASIADRDIPLSCVITPDPQMDLSKAPPAMQKLVAAGFHPQRIREIRVDQLRRLHARGVRVVTGIDAGLGPWAAHGNIHLGVTLLHEADFTPAEALASATSEAAKVCGLGKRKGLLQEGYDADLVVVQGDLHHDLTALRRVRLVVLAGKPVG
jgi:imidazolonepropionase-like amidohydrolase